MAPLTTASGTLVAGHGVASGANGDPRFPGGTIAMQAPHFAAAGVDIGRYHPATMNVSVAPRRLVVTAPQATLRQVRWHPTEPAEDFSFVACRVTAGGVTVDGLVYRPHPETKPEHYQPDSVVEILAPYLGELPPGTTVTVQVAPDQAQFA